MHTPHHHPPIADSFTGRANNKINDGERKHPPTTDNHTHTTTPEYTRRTDTTLDRKWAALKPHVFPGARILDYGCGTPTENGIREHIEAAGGVYECHDISATAETATRDAGATFRTKEDLTEQARSHDMVSLSSALHEPAGREEGFEEIESAWQLAAGGGAAVVRDWAGNQFQPISPLPRPLKPTSEDTMREALTWADALWANSALRVGAVKNRKADWDNHELHADPDNIYEIAFHSARGLESLPREAAESYGSAQNALSTHLRYWGDCTVEDRHDEWDETYPTHLQRLYDIDRLPWPTKTILTLRRSK